MPDIVSARPISGQPVATAWGDEVHDQLEGIQTAGPVTVATGSSAFAATWVAVTFPRAYTVAPRVFVVNQSGSAVVLGLVRNITATGCDVGAVRVDGNASSVNGAICWLAIGTPA